MSLDLKTYENKLLFIPLGGANEIGINVNLYYTEGKWIMVDCGSGFADDHLPGVDVIVADLSFIEAYKKDLLGIILTHAHEDHLGAVQYLWNQLQCPIYTTKFTKNFLQTKLIEYSFLNDIQINEVNTKSRFDLGPFNIEMIGLTHSAPEMQALMIRTKLGNILHTGDWKFDPKPVIGELSNEDALKACGDEGVLALVCDSTNVFHTGVSGSEGDVRESLIDIIAKCPKLVVVTTFASNLARLDTIISAAQKAGRKVALTGRSLHRMYGAARESGYLSDADPIIDERSVANYKREELLIIATGCQGEPLAAVSKLVNNSHHSIKLAPKDTVIFSSKIIPGNEKKIFRIFNLLVKKGIEVITERDHFVHVSGHPSIDELKKMYELVRPELCVPVHGEPVHIHEHAKIARSAGIKHAVEVENGSVLVIDKENPKIVDKVKSGYFAVDGNYLLPDSSSIFHLRKKMRDAGSVIVTLVFDNKSKLLVPPVLSTPGILDKVEDRELINQIQKEIVKTIESQRKHNGKYGFSIEHIEGVIKKLIKKTIKHEINKLPLIIVNVETV